VSLSAPSLDRVGVIPPLHFGLAAYHEHQVAEKIDRRRDIEHDIPLENVTLEKRDVSIMSIIDRHGVIEMMNDIYIEMMDDIWYLNVMVFP
jgi:hypothetical protein